MSAAAWAEGRTPGRPSDRVLATLHGSRHGGAMAERDTPSVRERRLARELRTLRTASQLHGKDVAARLGWSPSKVSRIETGRTGVAEADLERLAAGQQSDGGWTVDFDSYSPAASLAWRGHRTVGALLLLRDNGVV